MGAGPRGFQYRLAQFVSLAARHRIKPLFVFFDSCWDPLPKPGLSPRRGPGSTTRGWVQSPGAERLDDRDYYRTLHDYVTGVMTQFRYDDRVLGWDLWNEPDNMAREYSNVERSDKLDLSAICSRRCSLGAVGRCPPTADQWCLGGLGDRQAQHDRRHPAGNSDVITFHSYDKPANFSARIAELAPLGRPMMCTEYLARTRGNTIDEILPI